MVGGRSPAGARALAAQVTLARLVQVWRVNSGRAGLGLIRNPAFGVRPSVPVSE